jgi:hypothetical protein
MRRPGVCGLESGGLQQPLMPSRRGGGEESGQDRNEDQLSLLELPTRRPALPRDGDRRRRARDLPALRERPHRRRQLRRLRHRDPRVRLHASFAFGERRAPPGRCLARANRAHHDLKRSVVGRCRVGRLNLEGDDQGDLPGHGGQQRAVFV